MWASSGGSSTSGFSKAIMDPTSTAPIRRPPRPQFIATQGTGQWVSAGQFDPEQLRKLKALLDDGLITQDEYDRKRQQLMGQ